MSVAQLLSSYLEARGRGARAEFSRCIGLPAPTIGRWANGQTIPELHRAKDIARCMGATENAVTDAIIESQRQREDTKHQGIADLVRGADMTQLLESVTTLTETFQQLAVRVDELTRRVGQLEGWQKQARRRQG